MCSITLHASVFLYILYLFWRCRPLCIRGSGLVSPASFTRTCWNVGLVLGRYFRKWFKHVLTVSQLHRSFDYHNIKNRKLESVGMCTIIRLICFVLLSFYLIFHDRCQWSNHHLQFHSSNRTPQVQVNTCNTCRLFPYPVGKTANTSLPSKKLAITSSCFDLRFVKPNLLATVRATSARSMLGGGRFQVQLENCNLIGLQYICSMYE